MNNTSSSINCFIKLLQSITNYDLNQFTELSSNLTDILREIFSIPKLYTFIFGIINEYKDNIEKSLGTLNLLNICKNIDNDKYLVYEFCNGGDLRQYMNHFGNFDEELIQIIVIKIIRSIFYRSKRYGIKRKIFLFKTMVN